MIDELIKRLILLPREFYNKGNISIYSLLKESGYFECYDDVNERNIYEALTINRECINDWIKWSESKRTNSGWYLIKIEGVFILGNLSSNLHNRTIKYLDEAEACAAFIKQEIEDIRKI